MGNAIHRIAILNRGEAASRALRALRELRSEEQSDLVGIALYTEPDATAPFVREADESLSLGPALRASASGAMRPAYLDHERVLAALRAMRADAVWPGWGFLAEDPSFVEKLEASEIAFLGPSAATMRRLGDKIASKLMAEAARVPVTPWSGGPLAREDAERTCAAIGFPLMLKATAGGGGRGIRLVRSPDELLAAFDSATSEAANAFGDGTLFAEAAVFGARHVEVQMAADQHGTVLALGLRDCSVQRKHQKVVEEAPPPGLSDAIVRRIREASIRLLQQARYVGVATCEYLVVANDPQERFYFLEVNPRLQVEHGVTELLTDFDLVKAQIRIARGEALPKESPEERGCAIEVRLCAEDPANGFAPSPGWIALLDLPAGPGIRVDAGIASGGTIPSEFDSMVAKILARGATREEARARLVRAVSDARLVVLGGMTNKGFLLDVLEHPDFRRGGITTTWLDQSDLASAPEPAVEALIIAAIQSYQEERAKTRVNFFRAASRGRPRDIPPSDGAEIDLVYAGRPYRVQLFAVGGWSYRVNLGERVLQVTLLEQGPYSGMLVLGERRSQVLMSSSGVEMQVELDGRLHRVLCDLGGKVRAPSPALLIDVAVTPGQRVEAGARLGLFEAMKTETAFYAPLAGVVREILVRPGERVSAGDVILVIEPEAGASQVGTALGALELPLEPDPLEIFRGDESGADFERASSEPASLRAAAVNALRTETRRILMGYDANAERADLLVEVLEAPVAKISDALRSDLAALASSVEVYADVETLFSRAPTRLEEDELGPSNDARMAMYLRRIGVEGAGIDPSFLELLKKALTHYNIRSLAHSDTLERAVLRLYATRTTGNRRTRVIVALLHLLIGLAERGETFARKPELAAALDALSLLRGTVRPSVADLAAQARFMLFERPRRAESEVAVEPVPRWDIRDTLVEPPDPALIEQMALDVGLSPDEVRRIELWRLCKFELEPLDVGGFEGIHAFYGVSRDDNRDERIICFAAVGDVGPGVPYAPDLARFEERFHEAIEAMRRVQGLRDPDHRLQWNRLYLYVRPPIALSNQLMTEALRRLAPETGHLGLEKVIVRLASFERDAPDAPRKIELLAGNPTGSRVEWNLRVPHDRPLDPATPYSQRVASARARGLTYPYEIVRLFTAPPERGARGIFLPTGPGRFQEYELVDHHAVAVNREPGQNRAGVVFGVISTPTAKHPEGMRRVLILGDSTREMGALASGECDRIVAAIDLAEREQLPVEWIAVSGGALISMNSGTENLDATARVVRRLVTFTDAGGEVNVIVGGPNVGAQSYFDALAAMELGTRGVLIMLPNSYMVLTGRAVLEFSGAVAAEDEIGIGGYERIMGPSGEAHFQARDLGDAYTILLEHYGCSYVARGERTPRRFATTDSPERDAMREPYEGEEGWKTLGEVFSSEANPGRKRPFAMRPLMRALVDADAGWLERWRDWAGAETAIVWDSHLGGVPVTLVGIESRQIARIGYVPNDGPDAWTANTLFPYSSKKVARALNAASGNRPAVILANLSGFDGSPESMRRGILEYGAEIARAIVRFQGPIVFTVLTRYHGGAYVVFSHELNPRMRATALEGSYASVIGGPAAAAVIFSRDVRKRAQADPRVAQARAAMEAAIDPAVRLARRARLDAIQGDVMLEKQAEIAAEFDAIHSVERALEVGSIEAILAPSDLRRSLIHWLSE
ncbi:MAG TPA: carboxyl transferase domain-containing protein [Myxococcota bacterium]|nr:carboxyl transferase domain-containing protein [Myxococcota bacterium]